MSPGEAIDDESFTDAAFKGRIEDVRKMLANGANINARSKDGATALMMAAVNDPNDHTENKYLVLQELIRAGATIDARDDLGETALYRAVIVGHLPSVKALLAAGTDPTLKDNENHSVLHWAIDRYIGSNAVKVLELIEVIEQAIRGRAHSGYRGLQHAAWEVILRNTPKEHLDELPLPGPLMTYIKSNFSGLSEDDMAKINLISNT